LNREIRADNQLESLKYLRLDGENQMVSDLQMNDHKLVGLANATAPTDGVNKKVLDEAVKSCQRYTDNLIVQTNENKSAEIEQLRLEAKSYIDDKFERMESSIAVKNGRIVTNTETDELKKTILYQKIDRIEQNFVQSMNDLEFQFRKLQE